MTTLVPDIRRLNWQPKIGEPGEVVTEFDDINQCIRTIIMTPKGSDPLRPTFGADALQYIDIPENFATAPLIAEVAAAILAWEPRVELVAVRPYFDTAYPGHVDLEIAWKFRGIETEVVSRYTLARGGYQ